MKENHQVTVHSILQFEKELNNTGYFCMLSSNEDQNKIAQEEEIQPSQYELQAERDTITGLSDDITALEKLKKSAPIAIPKNTTHRPINVKHNNVLVMRRNQTNYQQHPTFFNEKTSKKNAFNPDKQVINQTGCSVTENILLLPGESEKVLTQEELDKTIIASNNFTYFKSSSSESSSFESSSSELSSFESSSSELSRINSDSDIVSPSMKWK